MKSSTKNKNSANKGISSRVSVTNRPTLKSQGAKYSTTNREGVTTFYASSKDAPGYNDTFQGKGVSSKGKPISKYDATGAVITSDSIKPDAPITLPKPEQLNGLGSDTDTINASLAGLSGGTYDTKSKQIVPAQPQTGARKILDEQIAAMKQDFSEVPTAESRVKKMQRDLRPREEMVNQLQNQVNTIVANRDAEILKLEGQGRGQTEGFIGGEQARITREAAIRAYPVQAQLAAAQDDLESARSYASQLFQAQTQDALAKYNHKKEINSAIFSYLNQEQQNLLRSKEREEDRAFQLEQGNRNTLKQLSMQALEWGQGALASEIMRLDPTSQTFDKDYADVTSRLRKPVGQKAPDIQNFGTAGNPDWRQYNPETGGWDEISGVGGGGGPGAQIEYESKKSAIQEDINRASELLNNSLGIKSSAGTYQPGFFGSLFTGAGGVKPEDGLIRNLTKFVPVIGNFSSASFASTQKNDFLSGVSYIVNNQTFDKLTTLKEGGATFGALSDSERVAIGRAATDLASSVEVDESGNITGFRGSEKKLVENLTKVLAGYKAAQDQLNIEYGVQPDERDEAVLIWNK